MITKARAIKSLRPGVEWTMSGDDVENIIWHTEGVTPLTEAEVAAEMTRLEEVKAAEEQAAADRRASAVAKLEALGLTVEEVSTVFGVDV
jgi:hypothetical protein